MPAARLPLLVAVVLPCFLASCIIHARSSSDRSGHYVGEQTLAQIEAGRSQDYVLGLLGEPTSRTSVEGGIEIWKWAYSESKTSRSGVFLIFSGRTTTSSQGAVYVEFKDSVVVKSWRD